MKNIHGKKNENINLFRAFWILRETNVLVLQ